MLRDLGTVCGCTVDHSSRSSLAVVFSVAGCAPPAPSPAATTTTFASDEEAFAAAEETYRGYIAAFNDVDLTKPETFAPVFVFTTESYSADERRQLSEMHAEGYVRGGDIVVVSFDPLTATEETVTARACTDTSQTTFTDAHGVSLVPPDRPDHVYVELTFTSSTPAALLDTSEVVTGESCAPSE
ncbi:hypothetical protein DXT68_09575 [Microbacterium foliorum]|uniref:hypothetical protein n=1 Tax=Microbacterium foliorum TaxID=104336 RepID=UPI0006967F45|nr:hypothetical protein [Microbacterium foliorum]AXL12361.1 hypothetical protein DXT68_09575 [Microbacterium foliorum]